MSTETVDLLERERIVESARKQMEDWAGLRGLDAGPTTLFWGQLARDASGMPSHRLTLGGRHFVTNHQIPIPVDGEDDPETPAKGYLVLALSDKRAGVFMPMTENRYFFVLAAALRTVLRPMYGTETRDGRTVKVLRRLAIWNLESTKDRIVKWVAESDIPKDKMREALRIAMGKSYLFQDGDVSAAGFVKLVRAEQFRREYGSEAMKVPLVSELFRSIMPNLEKDQQSDFDAAARVKKFFKGLDPMEAPKRGRGRPRKVAPGMEPKPWANQKKPPKKKKKPAKPPAPKRLDLPPTIGEQFDELLPT